MYRRLAGALTLVAAIGLGTTGCMGEYAMAAECEGFSSKVAKTVRDAYGTDPQIDDMWSGEADIWCSFDVETGSSLKEGEAQRRSTEDAVRALVDQDFQSTGVQVTLLYADGTDTVASADH